MPAPVPLTEAVRETVTIRAVADSPRSKVARSHTAMYAQNHLSSSLITFLSGLPLQSLAPLLKGLAPRILLALLINQSPLPKLALRKAHNTPMSLTVSILPALALVRPPPLFFFF